MEQMHNTPVVVPYDLPAVLLALRAVLDAPFRAYHCLKYCKEV